ncbi:MAG: 3-oxoadipate enol-lactonase [Acidimicrobiaceae bacterium]|nr:3-oxoadipate enol-lactonase [Acidimicrobiaceae bacterium]
MAPERPDRRLLLVHGFGGSRLDFADWLPRFDAAGWQAHAVELPGHGSALADPTGYSLSAFADFVLAEADRLGWPRFMLLGHSMGGMIAQLVALGRGADRLDGLILMGTSHGPIPVERDVIELGQSIVRSGGLAALVEAQRGRPGSSSHERLLRDRPGYREFMESKALAMDPAMWLALVEEMAGQADRLDGLRSLALATLVVVGEQDDFRPACERLAQAIPGARLAVIADAGHSPQFEAPEAWWHEISSFLEEVG